MNIKFMFQDTGGDLDAIQRRIDRELSTLKYENTCDVCIGSGDPGTGIPCMCNGTGKMHTAVRWLREENYKLQTAVEMAEARMANEAPALHAAYVEIGRLKAETDKTIAKLTDALEYYAHPEHYEPTERLCDTRPPGVLVDKGETARKALKK